VKSVLHISTECYPAAKAGGMGDVVGALPIYLPEVGYKASVIIPKYSNKWISAQKTKSVYKGTFSLGAETIAYKVEKVVSDELSFPLYVMDIPGKLDRDSIYLGADGEAYPDEAERNISFQLSILEWASSLKKKFDILHCHDHMTGLIPFLIRHSDKYKSLEKTPTFFTIHNGQYRGVFNWSKAKLLPPYDISKSGLLDWDNTMHSLAAAIKCATIVNTVSPSYMEELSEDFDRLTSLIKEVKAKTLGILNGIDTQVWDPANDPMISHHYKRSAKLFKKKNKEALAEQFDFDPVRPLVSFIGRFAFEKGADLLSGAIDQVLRHHNEVQFFILGSGDKKIEEGVKNLQERYPDNVVSVIAYNETLAHKIYASSDFIIMPSRFEPCGLNQMYAMRYGTTPIARNTGGLKDTVPDIGDGGNGIRFLRATEQDIVYSIGRALEFYADIKSYDKHTKKIMKLDFSWKQSAQKYADNYNKTLNLKT